MAAQARQYHCDDADLFLKSELRRGNVIVLLDGLDEVGIPDDVFTSIRQFIDAYPRNKFVLTSRVIGFDEAPWKDDGFVPLRIEPWEDDDIQRFCARWCA